MSDAVQTFEAQCSELVALLDEIPADRWTYPTRCDGWEVRHVAVHLDGILEAFAGDHSKESPGPIDKDRFTYYAYDPDEPSDDHPGKTDAEAIRDGTIDLAADRPPDEIRTSLRARVDAAVAAARDVPPDRVIMRGGRMLWGEFVASRVLEIAVHTMDIGHAVRAGERIAPQAVPLVTSILDGLLGERLPTAIGWDAKTSILTASGRRPLSPNERHVLGPLASRFPLFR